MFSAHHSISSQANLQPAVPSLSGHSPLSSALLSLLFQAVSGITSSTQSASSACSPIIDSNLFWVILVSGNISRQGCANKILRDANGKPLPPPNDIVLQHKEQVLFNNPDTGIFQLSKDHQNVYYHARQSCVLKKFTTFQPNQHCLISELTLAALAVSLRLFGQRIWHQVLPLSLLT